MDLSIYRNKIEDLKRKQYFLKRKIKKYTIIHSIIAIIISAIGAFLIYHFNIDKEAYILLLAPFISILIGYAIYSQYQKHKWLNRIYYPFILNIVNNESGTTLNNRLSEKEIKDCLINNKLINKFDNVETFISFSFETSAGVVNYFYLYVTRPSGDSSTEILHGDVFIIPYRGYKEFQLRNDSYKTEGMKNRVYDKNMKINTYYPKDIEPFEISHEEKMKFLHIFNLYTRNHKKHHDRDVIINYNKQYVSVYGEILLTLKFPKTINEENIEIACENVYKIKNRYEEIIKILNEKNDRL